MNVSINNYKKENKHYNKNLKNEISLKKAPTSRFNNQIYNRSNTTKIALEKAHYEAELLLEEEGDPTDMKNKTMFPQKKVSIFKFYCHLLEPIDWLYFTLGVIGLIIYELANPVLSF